ncbi:PLAC8-domain-containing protein [Pluteus cervinus]|uniref:PLAC8-domain-containing protein n=1 Tax=Pluteus cervinus TaxID=181527 RepID=A0ACD3ABL6_9AGAR|nr:PLAC8-domain-containing protein [Pluteus cervinus]
MSLHFGCSNRLAVPTTIKTSQDNRSRFTASIDYYSSFMQAMSNIASSSAAHLLEKTQSKHEPAPSQVEPPPEYTLTENEASRSSAPVPTPKTYPPSPPSTSHDLSSGPVAVQANYGYGPQPASPIPTGGFIHPFTPYIADPNSTPIQPIPQAYTRLPGSPGSPGEYPWHTTQQPEATPMMTLAAQTGSNRNMKNIPYEVQRDWSHGLYDCCPGGCITCCGASICPCIIYAKNKHRLEYLERQGEPDPDNGGCCSGDCWIHCAVSVLCLGSLLQLGPRSGIRSRYRIKGDGCGECCTVCWCSSCALTQESRELELEEKTIRTAKRGQT